MDDNYLKDLYQRKKDVIRSSFLGDHYINQERLTGLRKCADDAEDDVWEGEDENGTSGNSTSGQS